MHNSKPASESSIAKDFDCLRRTYLARFSDSSEMQNYNASPESNMDCPFAELSLIKEIEKGVYRKTPPLMQSIPSIILLAVILDQAEGSKEIKLSALQNDRKNVGRIFNLDTVLLLSILGDLENKDLLQVVRTAGLDVVRLKTEMTFMDCVKFYYEGLGNE